MLSASNLRVLALALLLQACATTSPSPQATAADPVQARPAHAQTPRAAAITANAAEQEP